MVLGSGQKGFKQWIFNFLLLNSVLWIRTAIKLPHDLGVCHKTVIHSDFFYGWWNEKHHVKNTLQRMRNPWGLFWAWECMYLNSQVLIFSFCFSCFLHLMIHATIQVRQHYIIFLLFIRCGTGGSFICKGKH